jgi:predicted dehydrogenase
MKHRIRVGIVGLKAERGWANAAHIPALRALSDDIEVVGVANTNRASAEAAVNAFGLGRAYDSVESLVASPDIDVVVVTVKVPHHLDLVTKVLEAGKNVYCEWPLGNGLAEAERLAALAKRKQVVAVVGTQAVVSPEVQFARDLVADGFVGEVRSTTYVGSGFTWGDDVDAGDVYAMDSKNGATLLSVIGGHAFSAVQRVLGPVSKLNGLLSQRRRTVRLVETGEAIPMKTPDQVIVAAEFDSGAPMALQLRGGLPCATRLMWEISGSERDLRISAKVEEIPVINISPLRVEVGKRGERGFSEIEVPSSYYFGLDDAPAARNVAGIYRLMIRDISRGTRGAPSFDDAVGLHRILDAVELSSKTGARQQIG